MDFENNLRKLSYVRKCVVDWVKTSRELSHWKDNGLKQISLKFRDAQTFEHATIGTAWAMISYYFWAHKLNSYDPGDLKHLHEVCEEIYSRIRSECKTWPKGGWGIQGTHGILFLIVRKFKPNILVETGIASGYSSTIILHAMKLNGSGKLISIDIADTVKLCGIERTSGWLVPDSFKLMWTKMIGRSTEQLSNINEEIDCFYHDSEHSEENMLWEYRWAAEHLKNGGVLISDDIDWNSAWNEFHRESVNFLPLIETVTTGVSIFHRT
ncbi:MAG: class I SAM-dependent methyltransferase [Thermoplasmatales archaeon]